MKDPSPEAPATEEWTPEPIRIDGVLHEWTPHRCPECKGAGEVYLAIYDIEGRCPACAGSGYEHRPIPEPTAEAR